MYLKSSNTACFNIFKMLSSTMKTLHISVFKSPLSGLAVALDLCFLKKEGMRCN